MVGVGVGGMVMLMLLHRCGLGGRFAVPLQRRARLCARWRWRLHRNRDGSRVVPPRRWIDAALIGPMGGPFT